VLQLWGNRFTSLPEEIGKLTSLRELYLMNNRIMTLPPILLKMKGLTYVDFQDNKLCTPSPELAAWLKKWDDMWKSKQKCW
jgi:Leucine-rich repeat (LRR) protein